MRILIHSNAPWAPTGYGQQTRLFARALKQAGHDVGISAFYGMQGALGDWEGIPVYPSWADAYGNDVVLAHCARHFKGDPKSGLLITLVDAWVMDPDRLSLTNCLAWTPVDHDPLVPRVAKVLHESRAFPVAMSRHGERLMRDAGLEPEYVPHGIDPALSPMDREQARRMVGLPEDRFIVGMVAANKGTPSRKGFGEVALAFKEFHAQHPEALLVLHTEHSGCMQGVNLDALFQTVGLPRDAVMFGDQYQGMVLGAPSEYMRALYSGIDVLINPAYGEGFGIPVVEAQACGTPVIVQDFTAMSELAVTGWKVQGQRFWTTQGSWQSVPSVKELAWALSEAHTYAWGMRDAAVEGVKEYGYGRVFAEHWQPVLKRMRERIEGTGEVTVEKVAA